MVVAAARRTQHATWSLARYCVGDTSVAGGFSRLLAAWRSRYSGSIVTYSDNRWSNGNLYRKTGFVLDGVVEPRYWYFQKGAVMRDHRFRWRKERALARFGGDPNRTEWEIMQANGYDRVWDAGKRRWRLD